MRNVIFLVTIAPTLTLPRFAGEGMKVPPLRERGREGAHGVSRGKGGGAA
ncbi:hypothetical protein FBZ81_104165 [Azospirillum brasilense]|nr:hypothetical protein OH82_02631 [Azospirillum brasilense]TWB83250.1 hypothetical protein FBZ81_104165 [Azospirillum brasilense]